MNNQSSEELNNQNSDLTQLIELPPSHRLLIDDVGDYRFSQELELDAEMANVWNNTNLQ